MRDRWASAFTETAGKYWTEQRTEHLTHGKNLILKPGDAPVLLRALGLLHRDASMPDRQRRKYFQINHMLAVLEPSLEDLCATSPTVQIIDAGCGRSYLTLLLAWAFRHRYQHPVKILGVDRRSAVIDECRRRTTLAQLDDLVRYEASDIDDLEIEAVWTRAFGASQQETGSGIDGLIALHACNTATDDAIALGVRAGAQLIAVAPCCQSELAARLAKRVDEGSSGNLSPVWSSPHLRRHGAALMTDTMRMLLLRAAGWEATALEFVASSHTPKNTLIRGTRRGVPNPDALAEYRRLQSTLAGCGIALESQLALDECPDA